MEKEKEDRWTERERGMEKEERGIETDSKREGGMERQRDGHRDGERERTI